MQHAGGVSLARVPIPSSRDPMFTRRISCKNRKRLNESDDGRYTIRGGCGSICDVKLSALPPGASTTDASALHTSHVSQAHRMA